MWENCFLGFFTHYNCHHLSHYLQPLHDPTYPMLLQPIPVDSYPDQFILHLLDQPPIKRLDILYTPVSPSLKGEGNYAL